VHPGLVLITCKRGVKKGGSRVPTSGLHAINACWFLFLLSAYLVVAGAASFDKKELCRSDTQVTFDILYIKIFLKELYGKFLYKKSCKSCVNAPFAIG